MWSRWQIAHRLSYASRTRERNGLVQSQTGQPFDVLLLGFVDDLATGHALTLVDRNDELLLCRLLGDQPHRVPRQVDAGCDPDEPEQRSALRHRAAESHVLVVVRVRSTPLLAQ